jgi:hypothetical protein
VTFGCSPHEEAQYTIGKGVVPLPKVANHVKLVLEVVLIKSTAPFPFD